MHYKFVVVEGNIGVGKTTLASMLAKDYNARLVLEKFEENPFLPKFYKDPEKNAFPLELFFMAERYHQLKKEKEQDLFQPITIADYFFIKSKLFAQNNLQKDEQQLFNSLFEIMLSSLPKPDLLVYLYADVDRLQQNIKNRGRSFEQEITNEYLQNIQDRYLDYLRKQIQFPVLLLNVSNID
ncbi:deoxynucleoside kinase, partial [Flavobacteriales bacterium]|nr:deoxynucleoside kinase [Flavobacteriales bacterium]